jgi:hypothetical protein
LGAPRGLYFFDGSDIQKKYAKMMEGLDNVKDGDKSSIGLGYWLMNVVHFSKEQEMTPLFNNFTVSAMGQKAKTKKLRRPSRKMMQ